MLSYIIRRLILLPLTLIGITAIVFFVIALSPGGIGASLLSGEGSMRPAERAAREKYLNERYGLDRPYFVQYGHWLNNVSPIGFKTYTGTDVEVIESAKAASELPVDPITGKHPRPSLRAGDIKLSSPTIKSPDLGESFTKHQKVSALIIQALPVSIVLQLVSIPLTYFIAIFSGIYAAKYRGQAIDVGTSFVLIALFSVPVIWVGVLFIGFICNTEFVRWFPSNGLHDILSDDMTFLPHFAAGHWDRGWLFDAAWHLVGPVICISYAEFAILSKLTRGALLDTLGLDFVRTARAKGLSERVVLYRHAFRNSLIPLITVAAYILPQLIAGAIVVETIFGLEGMGNLTITALEARDRELFLSTTMIISFLTLIGYLLADIAYAVADPRVSYDA